MVHETRSPQSGAITKPALFCSIILRITSYNVCYTKLLRNLGFLPGDLREKLDPYLQPLYDALLDMIPFKKLEKYMEEKVVQIAPLAFMRGRTLSDAFVILVV